MESPREYPLGLPEVVEKSALPHAPMTMPEQNLWPARVRVSLRMLLYWLAWR